MMEDPKMAEAIATISMRVRARQPIPSVREITQRWRIGTDKAILALDKGIAMGSRKIMSMLYSIPTTGQDYQEWRR